MTQLPTTSSCSCPGEASRETMQPCNLFGRPGSYRLLYCCSCKSTSCINYDLADVPQRLVCKMKDVPFPHDEDVVCLIKRFISDSDLSQPPLFVCPHDRLARLSSLVPLTAMPRKPVQASLRDKWLQLADAFVEAFSIGALSAEEAGQPARAAAYLRALALGHIGAGAPAPQMQWHKELGARARVIQIMPEAKASATLLPVKPLVARWRR